MELHLGQLLMAISFFFAGETIARFLGAIILNWIKPRLFLFLISVLLSPGVLGVFFSPGNTIAFIFNLYYRIGRR